MSEVFLRTPFNYDRDEASCESGVDCSRDECRVVQSEKDRTDINNIVRKYEATGQVPVGRGGDPMFGDFTGVGTLEELIGRVRKAEQAFAELPVAVRKRFGNDVDSFIQFCGEKENLPLLREWGLAPPLKKEDDPVVVKQTGDGDGQ